MKIHFYKEENKWYVSLPETDFSQEELEMVDGADILCERYAQGNSYVDLDIQNEWQEDYDCYDKISEDEGGATYLYEMSSFEFWLCSVTKFLFGEYPSEIYIKKI